MDRSDQRFDALEIDAPIPRPWIDDVHRLNDGRWYYVDQHNVLWCHPEFWRRGSAAMWQRIVEL